jgi:molybdopterin converting factor small subunit
MQGANLVTITSFGQGRYDVALPPGKPTVAEILGLRGVETEQRRVAVNGHASGMTTVLEEGDEVTVVPRVRAG